MVIILLSGFPQPHPSSTSFDYIDSEMLLLATHLSCLQECLIPFTISISLFPGCYSDLDTFYNDCSYIASSSKCWHMASLIQNPINSSKRICEPNSITASSIISLGLKKITTTSPAQSLPLCSVGYLLGSLTQHRQAIGFLVYSQVVHPHQHVYLSRPFDPFYHLHGVLPLGQATILTVHQHYLLGPLPG